MTLRRLTLKVHLYLGLTAAIFIAILGLTGSVIAFETELDHGLRSSLWYGKTGPTALSDGDLIEIAEQRFAPARIASLTVPVEPELAHVMEMSDGMTVYINPYDGSILGRVPLGQAPILLRIVRWLSNAHRFLVPLPKSAPGLVPVGARIVSFAGLIVFLMVLTGVILWWRTKRASVRWNAPWFRVFLDAHLAVGIFAALSILVASVTGTLIGFGFGEEALSALQNSSGRRLPPKSAVAEGVTRISPQQALVAGSPAVPGATLAGLQTPRDSEATYVLSMRAPGDTWEPPASIFVDQYTGRVLEVRNPITDFPGFWAILLNRAIHTGDVWGLPGHILTSAGSVALVWMVISGLVIWWKKLTV